MSEKYEVSALSVQGWRGGKVELSPADDAAAVVHLVSGRSDGWGTKGRAAYLSLSQLRDLAAACTALADDIEAEGCTPMGGPIEEAIADWATLPAGDGEIH